MEIDFIKKTIGDLLDKFGIEFKVETVKDKDINATRFLVKTNESNLLIGYKGNNLIALSHIVKRIVDKEFKEEENRIYFIIDINDYQKNKIEELKTSAHMLAERAKYFKSSVEMNPLPPHERMIIHSLFSLSKEFETASKGEGVKRRVVIQYTGE
jgi:spoIIIJ-associated protein